MSLVNSVTVTGIGTIPGSAISFPCVSACPAKLRVPSGHNFRKKQSSDYGRRPDRSAIIKRPMFVIYEKLTSGRVAT